MRGASRLRIPPYYKAFSLTTPLPSLCFVRFCFHLSSFCTLSPYYPIYAAFVQQCTIHVNSFFLHTYLLFLLPRLPKLNIRRCLVFDFEPKTAKIQIPLALAPGPHFWRAPCLLFVWGPGYVPTLTNLQGGTSAYTRRSCTRGRSVGLP